MNLAEKVAAQMPVSLIGADENTKIREITNILGSMGQTPHEIRTLYLMDEDFLPDALSAFRYRVEQEIISQERAF
jgi:hypothetical protein